MVKMILSWFGHKTGTQSNAPRFSMRGGKVVAGAPDTRHFVGKKAALRKKILNTHQGAWKKLADL